jgi:hypothetical protein
MIAIMSVIVIIQFAIAKMVIQVLHVNSFLALIHVVIKDSAIRVNAIANQGMVELIVPKKLVKMIAIIMDYVLKTQNAFVSLVLKELIAA